MGNLYFMPGIRRCRGVYKRLAMESGRKGMSPRIFHEKDVITAVDKVHLIEIFKSQEVARHIYIDVVISAIAY